MLKKKKRVRKRTFQTPKGTRDILPGEQIYWQRVREVVKNLSKIYGFQRIDTPIIEETDLFIKGTGAETDIVEKEMYSFKTKGGDRLSLRPEFTPSVIRAYLEGGLSSKPHPIKLYSIGPLFRYDRPQKGRYRQFYQANFEVIGEKEPIMDAQLIQLFFAIVKDLGLKNLITQINSIGCPKCRPDYKRVLKDFYRPRLKEFCPDCQRRFKQNPLRLLDCKDPRCIKMTKEAPEIIDNLCTECHNHFRNVLEYLDELNIPYILNPHLVRGLDYYTKTVFEVVMEEDESRQNSLGGGGRYDDLVKLLGGKSTPAIGFAIGLDRIVELMKERQVKINERARPLVFLVQLGDLGKKKSLGLFEELRNAGLTTASAFSKNTIKAQLKIANKMGAKFALIVGQKEALDDTIIIRDMTSGNQEVIPISKTIKEIKKRLKNNK